VDHRCHLQHCPLYRAVSQRPDEEAVANPLVSQRTCFNCWDSYYDEDLTLEAAEKARITSKSLRDAGRKMLSGTFPS